MREKGISPEGPLGLAVRLRTVRARRTAKGLGDERCVGLAKGSRAGLAAMVLSFGTWDRP